MDGMMASGDLGRAGIAPTRSIALPGAGIGVQHVLLFHPIEEGGPGFFGAFYSAFAPQEIAMEVPAQARIEVE